MLIEVKHFYKEFRIVFQNVTQVYVTLYRMTWSPYMEVGEKYSLSVDYLPKVLTVLKRINKIFYIVWAVVYLTPDLII